MRSRSPGASVALWLGAIPAIAVIALFVAALAGMLGLSTGLIQASATPRIAEINGEVVGLTAELWSTFLGQPATLTVGVSLLTLPAWACLALLVASTLLAGMLALYFNYL